MTFESEGLLIVAIYTWLPPASYVVFSDNSGWFKMWKVKIIMQGYHSPWKVLEFWDFLEKSLKMYLSLKSPWI